MSARITIMAWMAVLLMGCQIKSSEIDGSVFNYDNASAAVAANEALESVILTSNALAELRAALGESSSEESINRAHAEIQSLLEADLLGKLDGVVAASRGRIPEEKIHAILERRERLTGATPAEGQDLFIFYETDSRFGDIREFSNRVYAVMGEIALVGDAHSRDASEALAEEASSYLSILEGLSELLSEIQSSI